MAISLLMLTDLCLDPASAANAYPDTAGSQDGLIGYQDAVASNGWARIPLALGGRPSLVGITTLDAPRGATPEELVMEAVYITNQQRNRAGLLPLKSEPGLTAAAQGLSQDMALHDFFSHTGSDGGSLVTRFLANNYFNWSAGAENIAAGISTAEGVIDAWMNSLGHRNNILNPDFTEIGIGYYYQPDDQPNVRLPDGSLGGAYFYYWTQDFGARYGVFPLVINLEAPTTADPDVSLAMRGQGWAQEMQVSNRSDFADAVWEPFRSNRSWRLLPGNGQRRVYARLRNAQGQTLDSTDDIELVGQVDVPAATATTTATARPAATSTPTSPPATNTPTRVPPTPAATTTSVPTPTLVPPKSTATSLPTSTATRLPPTRTPTQVPPKPTATPLPPSDTPVPTPTEPDPTVTSRPAMPTATPTLGSSLPPPILTINDGERFTSYPQVTLHLALPMQASQLEVSSTPNFAGAGRFAAKGLLIWQLNPDVAGEQKVYVRYHDSAGARSPTSSAAIVYDPSPPLGRISVVSSNGVTVLLQVEAWDPLSGVCDMALGLQSDALSWQPYRSMVKLVLQDGQAATGTPVVYARFRDAVGNESQMYSSNADLPQLKHVFVPLAAGMR